MPVETRNIESLTIRAAVQPSTFDKAKRTIEVVFATDAPVPRGYSDDRYNEILSLDKSHIRLDRLNAGGPVCNSHNRYSLDDQIGVVEKAWVKDGVGMAVLRFSNREDVAPILQDIEDGIIKNVSVGYRVYKYEKTITADGIPNEMRAIDWEPYEISMVVVPADYQSTVRDNDTTNTNTVQIISTSNITKNRAMTVEEQAAADKQRNLENEKLQTEATDAALARALEITEAVRTAGLPINFAEKLIKEKKTVDEARKLIIEEWGKKDPNEGTNGNHRSITVGADERDKKREGMEHAMQHRAGNIAEKDLKPEAREYRGMSLLRLAEEVLNAQGVNTRGMSARALAETALLGRSGMHSTSDFPIILGNTVNRTLQRAYEQAPRTFMPFCNRTTSTDFKAKTVAKLSGLVGKFDKVAEGGEYKNGTLTESGESYSLEKFGKIIPITWETIINDDLSAFTRIPTAMAEEAAQMQSDLVWKIFIDNATMSDGKALFHADHGNLISSGTAISIDSLGAMRQKFRVQTGLNGRLLNLSPDFLIVSSLKEQLAKQYTSVNYTSATPGNVNLPENTNMQVIVEPRLDAINSGLSWFGAVSPRRVDTIEYAFLEGDGELFTEQKVGFEIDGLQVKARMVFAAKAIDHRGLLKNVGA